MEYCDTEVVLGPFYLHLIWLPVHDAWIMDFMVASAFPLLCGYLGDDDDWLLTVGWQLALLAPKDDVVDVIVYSRPVNNEFGSLFGTGRSLV